MRTFKKGDRVLKTDDNTIAAAILNSGFEEVKATVEKPIEEQPKKAKKKGE